MANSKQPVVIKNTSPYGVQLYTEEKKLETDVIIEPVLQEKTIVPNKNSQEVTADDGYAGIGKLNLEPIPEEYIIPQGSVTITENKTVDVTQYKTAIVNIPTGSDNPLTATTDTNMESLLTQDNVGKVARFNGTSDTYVDGGYYLIEAVEPDGYAVTIDDTGGWGPTDITVTQSDNTTSFIEEVGYLVMGTSKTMYITKRYMRLSNNDIVSYNGGVVPVSGLNGVFEVTGNGTITMQTSCLTGDTLVTMADRTEKRLDEIEVGDYILSYDWGTMSLVPNKVTYTDKDMNKTHTEYDVWTFDDGSVVKTVHRHRFFNVERKAFVYMDEWKIGEHTVKIDGSMPMLVSHETITETVNHYKITGELGTNYFANGLLTGDRYCPTEIDFEGVLNNGND